MTEPSKHQLSKRLLRQLGRAIEVYNMIEEGDRVMVCISGGKDSWCMLHLLSSFQKKMPFSFELLAVHLDQGEPYAPVAQIAEALAGQSVPYEIVHKDIYQIVEERLRPGQMRCSLCSKMRRGALYHFAEELGCNKIALGHHRDDFIETLLLNQFFVGRLSAMPPYLRSDDGRHVVIRPLVFAAESDLVAFAPHTGYPVFSCQTCDTIDGKRQRIKKLLSDLESEIPNIKQSLLRSLSEVRPTQLMDQKLWKLLEDEPEHPCSAS